MTKKEQRMAILEKMGWRNLKVRGLRDDDHHLFTALSGSAPGEALSYISEAPGLLDSLDEMHTAENVLTDGQQDTYLQNLAQVVGYIASKHSDEFPNTGLMKIVSATAAQRGEAFCRTFWPEKFKD